MNFWSRGVLVFGARALVYLQSLLLVPIVVKLAGPETFGAFSLAITALGFVYAASPMGVGLRARRDLSAARLPADHKRLFFPQFWFHVAALALWALALGQIMKLLIGGTAPQVSLPVWTGVIYLYAYLLYSQFSSYLFYAHHTRAYAAGTVAFAYVFLGLVVLGYWLGAGLTVTSLVLGQAVAAAMVGALLATIVFREIGLALTIPSASVLRADLRFGLPLLMATVIDVILSAADRFVILGVLSVKAVGLYVPAYTLGMLVMLYPQVFGALLVPALARDLGAENGAEARELVNRVIRGLIALAVPFAVGCLVLGRPVLELFANREVAEAAWDIVPIIAVAALFCGLNAIYASVLTVASRTRVLFLANLQAAILNVGLNVLLLPVFKSLLVPAMVTLVSSLAAMILLVRQVRECWEIDVQPDFVFRVGVAALLMGATTQLVYLFASAGETSGLWPLALALTAAVAMYALASVLLKIVSPRDLVRIVATARPEPRE